MYSTDEIRAMAQTLRRDEAAQLEAIRLMVKEGHDQATIRLALGLSRATWFRRWARYKDLANDARRQLAS